MNANKAVTATFVPLALGIGDALLPEGNSGTKNFVFTVRLNALATQTVTVKYATADGTALAGSDYGAQAGTLTFSPGQTSKTLTVPVKGDSLAEANEDFFVELASPSGARLADALGWGTIYNDDNRFLRIHDVAKGITVAVAGDTRKEATETFQVYPYLLTGATLLDAFGRGTISNDD